MEGPMPPKLFPKSRTTQTDKGFSILETILALALLGVALTSMVRLLADAVGVMERGRRAGQALVVASAVADALQAAPADRVWPGEPEVGQQVTAGGLLASWRVEPLPGDGGLLVLSVEVSRPGRLPGLPPLARRRRFPFFLGGGRWRATLPARPWSRRQPFSPRCACCATCGAPASACLPARPHCGSIP
jgi:prepilin-type N-terminal cleavage/methylation domain-containing protein